jgi:hypothetical protein
MAIRTADGPCLRSKCGPSFTRSAPGGLHGCGAFVAFLLSSHPMGWWHACPRAVCCVEPSKACAHSGTGVPVDSHGLK